jgi:hypothetical protein
MNRKAFHATYKGFQMTDLPYSHNLDLTIAVSSGKRDLSDVSNAMIIAALKAEIFRIEATATAALDTQGTHDGAYSYSGDTMDRDGNWIDEDDDSQDVDNHTANQPR